MVFGEILNEKKRNGKFKWKLHCSDSLINLRESYWKIKSLESEIRELKKRNEQLTQEKEKYLGRRIEKFIVTLHNVVLKEVMRESKDIMSKEKPILHIYTRVSTVNQENDGTSLDSQLKLGKDKKQSP